jgi:general secretion pathway protein G
MQNCTCKYCNKKPLNQGFTLVEFGLTVFVAALFFSMIIPAGINLTNQVKSNSVTNELQEIADKLNAHFKAESSYPDTLEEALDFAPMDPWNNPYQYLKIYGGNKKNKGKIRKNKSANGINSRFDLYSMGLDGESVAPLTAKSSRDDIIYALDGRYIGPANEFE